ncbi:MAG: hypothetical protein AB7F30_11315 [Flavobacteriaceae bacterium]
MENFKKTDEAIDIDAANLLGFDQVPQVSTQEADLTTTARLLTKIGPELPV